MVTGNHGHRSRMATATATALALAAAGSIALIAGCADNVAKPTLTAASTVRATCADFDFPIYFEGGSDQLTGAARQTIGLAAARVRGCALGPLDVVGLAGTGGRRGDSLELSRRRAAVVAQALKGAGLPAPRFDIDAIGAAGAKEKRGRSDPLRRRTEVVIRAAPPALAPAPAKG